MTKQNEKQSKHGTEEQNHIEKVNRTDDTISRKTVINGLDYIITELDKLIEEDPFNKDEYHYIKKQVEEIKNGVQNLPTEQSERKKGEWIRNDNGTYSCSVCHSWIPEEQHYYARYCLYCGMDMRGEQNG